MELLYEKSYTNTKGEKFNIRILNDRNEKIIAAVNEYSESNNLNPVMNYSNLEFPYGVDIEEIMTQAKAVANNVKSLPS